MNTKSKNTDILHGPLVKSLILFTLPIALSSMIQQLFNSADTWVVGYFGDPDALAAVGINTETVALVVTLSAGLAAGANVAVAAAVGKNRTDQVRSIAASAVVIALTVGLAGLIVGQYAAAPLLRLIKTPENIFDMSKLYLRIYFYGYPFLLLYDFGAAILRAKGDSKYPFLALIASGAVNVILNIIFVAALGAGVAGVAAATGISTAVSAVLVTFKLYKRGDLVLSAGELQGFFKDTAEILKTGIPAAVQGAVFCFANIFVQASVNLFGSEAIAGSAVAMNFEYFVYYVITAFGQTERPLQGRPMLPETCADAAEYSVAACCCHWRRVCL